MPRYKFEKVEVREVKRWKDPATGRSKQHTRTFFQTINPWNKNKAGEVKTREEILAELRAEAARWLALPGGQE